MNNNLFRQNLSHRCPSFWPSAYSLYYMKKKYTRYFFFVLEQKFQKDPTSEEVYKMIAAMFSNDYITK